MAMWAIAYDLDVGAMKTAGKTKSQVTTFYNQVRECLTANRFEKFQQLSIYTSSEANTITNAFKACQALKLLPDSNSFIKRLHLFRVEDQSDLLPLVAGRDSADRDATQEIIDQVFPEAALGVGGTAAKPAK